MHDRNNGGGETSLHSAAAYEAFEGTVRVPFA